MLFYRFGWGESLHEAHPEDLERGVGGRILFGRRIRKEDDGVSSAVLQQPRLSSDALCSSRSRGSPPALLLLHLLVPETRNRRAGGQNPG